MHLRSVSGKELTDLGRFRTLQKEKVRGSEAERGKCESLFRDTWSGRVGEQK